VVTDARVALERSPNRRASLGSIDPVDIPRWKEAAREPPFVRGFDLVDVST